MGQESQERRGADARIAAAGQAWQAYVGQDRSALEAVRPHIARAWARCAAHGTDPRHAAARRLSREQTAALLAREVDFVEACRPYLRALSQAAGSERHAAMLADRNAVLLDLLGDEATMSDPTFPGPGSILSEEVAGANGIGTAAADVAYTELVGPEHWIEGFHAYTCQGLPMWGPDGSVAGVLSTSVRRIEASERLHQVLICAAHGVEAELMRRHLERQMAAAARLPNAPQLEALRQDLVQLQAASRLWLQRGARRSEREGDPAVLLQSSQELARAFRRRSERWQEIATEGAPAPETLDLADRARELATLLRTEAATRGLTLGEPPERGPEVMIHADSREVSRQVFEAFVAVFDDTRASGVVEVELTRRAGQATLVIRSGSASQALTWPEVRP